MCVVQVVNEGFTLKPQSFGGFGYMWAGCRATYGVSDGKVAFQMKVSFPEGGTLFSHSFLHADETLYARQNWVCFGIVNSQIAFE